MLYHRGVACRHRDSEPAHEHLNGGVGVGGDILGEGIDVGGVFIFAEEEQQAVTQHRHGGYGVGVSAAGLVFLKAGVFAPMIADLYASPMAADTL